MLGVDAVIGRGPRLHHIYNERGLPTYKAGGHVEISINTACLRLTCTPSYPGADHLGQVPITRPDKSSWIDRDSADTHHNVQATYSEIFWAATATICKSNGLWVLL
jgi:hypothetical protein